MLTDEQKVEIRKLRKQGWKFSKIARETKHDWKTCKEVCSQDGVNGERSPNSYPQHNDLQAETDLVKIVFEKLNAGISPREIIPQVGNVNLVVDCFNQWVALGEHPTKDLDLPDPKIVRSWDTWQESAEKHFAWHQKKAIKNLAVFAWIRMKSCANLKNEGVECLQLEEGATPYECLGCTFYSERQ